jgi:predicted Zn-dependent peptidase
MDPITTAIVAALSAGAIGGLTETSKTAITDAYNRLKALLTKKFGTNSEVVQAIGQLETKPTSSGRKETLQEEIATVKADQDEEILAMAKHLLTVAQPQQAGLGKFTIQTNAPVQGLSIGDHNTITQHFDNPRKP